MSFDKLLQPEFLNTVGLGAAGLFFVAMIVIKAGRIKSDKDFMVVTDLIKRSKRHKEFLNKKPFNGKRR